ncbi:MAG: hypothetical protein QM500_12220 [Methylococcales bacterium]
MALDDGNKTESHPSFGMLGFNRIQSSKEMVLNGSDLTHTTVIEMCLYRSTKDRGLHQNWHHATDKVASVYMSQNQFSELITSMNMGDGVPVTLNFTETDGRIEPPVFKSVVEVHKGELDTRTQKILEQSANTLKRATELLQGSGTLKKADREKLLNDVQMLEQNVRSNMPFMKKQFEEAMDDVVTDAKGSIEAFYQHRVTKAGLKTLSDESQVSSPKIIES